MMGFFSSGFRAILYRSRCQLLVLDNYSIHHKAELLVKNNLVYISLVWIFDPQGPDNCQTGKIQPTYYVHICMYVFIYECMYVCMYVCNSCTYESLSLPLSHPPLSVCVRVRVCLRARVLNTYII